MQRPWGGSRAGLFEGPQRGQHRMKERVVTDEGRGVGGIRSCRSWQAIVRTLAREQTWMQRRNREHFFFTLMGNWEVKKHHLVSVTFSDTLRENQALRWCGRQGLVYSVSTWELLWCLCCLLRGISVTEPHYMPPSIHTQPRYPAPSGAELHVRIPTPGIQCLI